MTLRPSTPTPEPHPEPRDVDGVSARAPDCKTNEHCSRLAVMKAALGSVIAGITRALMDLLLDHLQM